MNTFLSHNCSMKKELWNQKAKRLLRGTVTMQQVADRLHITKGAVSLKLSGQRDSSLDEIREIAKMIGITFTELVENDPRVATNSQEKQLIDTFRSISDEDKERILLMIEVLKST